MKISKRLSTINSLITHSYDDIWDCCCDHGLLGFQLLADKKANTIHFVDCLKALTDKVEIALSTYYPGFTQQHEMNNHQSLWQVHTLNMLESELPLAKENKQLIIIAGVGGDLLIKFIKKIISDNPLSTLEFILCPVHHEYYVRESLIHLDLSLISETIVYENKRFYEVLHVSYQPELVKKPANERITRGVSLTGEQQWQYDNTEHKSYLFKLVRHYTRRLKAPLTNEERARLNTIVQAYSAVLAKFT